MEKRTFTFSHIVWSNASGVEVSRSGGRYLQMAKKLVKNGTAKLINKGGSTAIGCGRTYDTALTITTYSVTEL